MNNISWVHIDFLGGTSGPLSQDCKAWAKAHLAYIKDKVVHTNK